MGADLLPQNGQVVTVAIVDSGITNHVDLSESNLNVNQALSSNSRVLENVVFGNYVRESDRRIFAGSKVAAGATGGQSVAG